MTLGVKKVSKPFSVLELCTIVREHDVDKADQLRDRFEDFSLNNFTVAWTLSTVTIGGDLVVKLPISYGNLRKAKYDESIVLAFAKNLLAALPTISDSKGLVASWGEGEYEKYSLAEIVGTLTKPTLRGRLSALFKVEGDYLNALSSWDSYRELGNALLKDTDYADQFVDAQYVADYAFALVGLAKDGFRPGDDVVQILNTTMPVASVGNVLGGLLGPLKQDGGAYGLVIEDISNSFGVSADSFKGGLDCRPCSWFMRLLMAHYSTKTKNTMEVLRFAPTGLDADSPMGYLVLPPHEIRALGDTIMEAKKGAYRAYTNTVNITRLTSLVFASNPTPGTESDYRNSRVITELLAEVSAKQVTKISDEGYKLSFTYKVRTSVNGGIEVKLTVDANGKGTQYYSTTGLGLSGFFKIMDIFRPYGSYSSNDPFTPYAAAYGADFQKDNLGACSALVPMKASTMERFVEEQKFWAKVGNPLYTPQNDVEDGKHLIALYRENLMYKDEFDLKHFPHLFNEDWLDFTKLPSGHVNTATMSDDEIMDELFGTPKLKPEEVLFADPTTVPTAEPVSLSTLPTPPSLTLSEPIGFAATLSVDEAFKMQLSPPDSYVGEGIGQFMKPRYSGNPYYRVLQVHETTSSKSVVGVRLQGKTLSFRAKGEICNRLQKELLKMCFKDNGEYMSIHLEVHDSSAVIAMTNTILGRLVESGVKVHTIFLAQG